MSTVCDMILSVCIGCEHENIASFNDWAKNGDHVYSYAPVVKVSENPLFQRVIQHDIYMFAYNGLYSYEIARFWQGVKLEDPDGYQLMLKDEDAETFEIYSASSLHEWEFYIDEWQCIDRRPNTKEAQGGTG